MGKKSYFLGEIADSIGAELTGNPDSRVDGIASLENAKEGQISFLVASRYQLTHSSRYEKYLPYTKASAVLLSPHHAPSCPVDKLIIDDPYPAYIKLAALFEKKSPVSPGIHPTAVIGANCDIHPSVSIGPYCVIGDNCRIEAHTVIDAHTILKEGVTIGKEGWIASRVMIYSDTVIGDRVVIQCGAIIGKDGFSMIRTPAGWKKIPHLGTVIIGNEVEIGANTTVDRGSLDNTILENGVKLDNQIQVAHGVVIGENTVIAACTGIAGSTHIGKNCMIGGATGINDNIVICDNVIFTGMAQVVKSINLPGVYSSGTGIQPQKMWHKSVARLHDLDNLARKVKKMEKEKHE